MFCLLRRPDYTRSVSNSSKFFSISKTVSINPIKHEVKGNGYTFKRLLRSCLEIGLESLYRLQWPRRFISHLPHMKTTHRSISTILSGGKKLDSNSCRKITHRKTDTWASLKMLPGGKKLDSWLCLSSSATRGPEVALLEYTYPYTLDYAFVS